MNRWLKRTLYVAFFIFWLVVISLPAIGFILAARGEIALGDDPQQQTRLFLLQEEDVEGIGLVRSRPVTDTPRCVETRVSYFLWEGDGESSVSCQCYEEDALVSTTQRPCPANPAD